MLYALLDLHVLHEIHLACDIASNTISHSYKLKATYCSTKFHYIVCTTFTRLARHLLVQHDIYLFSTTLTWLARRQVGQYDINLACTTPTLLARHHFTCTTCTYSYNALHRSCKVVSHLPPPLLFSGSQISLSESTSSSEREREPPTRRVRRPSCEENKVENRVTKYVKKTVISVFYINRMNSMGWKILTKLMKYDKTILNFANRKINVRSRDGPS